MDDLRVLMFGWELPPENSGGLGVACLGLSQKLNKKGVNLTFVVPRKTEKMEKDFFDLMSADVNYEEVVEIESCLTPYLHPEKYKKYKSVLCEENNIYGDTLFDEVKRYRKCARKVAVHKDFDIIHAHDWLSFGAGIEAKKLTGKPLVVHVHATEFDRGGGTGVDKRVYELEKEGLKFADKIIAVSNYTKNIIIEKYGIEETKVEVAHNGVNIEEVPAGKSLLEPFKEAGYGIVLFVGRITIQKGPDYFLEAARKSLDYNRNIVFVIAGSGDMEHQIMHQASQLGISDNVIFPGFVRGDELHGLYKAADLFVMPSVSEPFGLTPLEALTNETPVLVSKQSGVSEVLTHALKVDFWDIDEMTNKILTTVEHNSLKKSLAQNGKKEVKEITWDPAAEKCLKIYKSLIK